LSLIENNIVVKYKTWNNKTKNWLDEIDGNSSKYSGEFGSSICCVKAYANAGNLYYRVHCMDENEENSKEWLPEVKNNDSYAGIYGTPIDGFAIKSDFFKLEYRAHSKKRKKWLGWIKDYDLNDSEYGYAGILGEEIDAIQIVVPEINRRPLTKRLDEIDVVDATQVVPIEKLLRGVR